MMILALCLSIFALQAENVLFLDHPIYRSNLLSRRPVTDVVAGMPVVLRAAQETVTPTSTSVSLRCIDPTKARAAGLVVGDSAQIEVRVERESNCEYQAILPPDLPPGPVEAFFHDGEGIRYGPAHLNVVSTRIGVLNSLDPAWLRMPAAAAIVNAHQRSKPSLLNPVRPQSSVEVRVMGYGMADLAQVIIQLGDDAIPLADVNPAPGEIGVHILGFKVPENPSYTGCSVPLLVRTGEIVSNLTTLPVAAANGSCNHKLGLSEREKASLDAGQSIPIGILSLGSTQNIGGTSLPSFGVRMADARAVADIAGTDAPLQPNCQLSRDWLGDLRTERQPPTFVDFLPAGPSTVTSPQQETFRLFSGARFALSGGTWQLHVEAGGVVTASTIASAYCRNGCPKTTRRCCH
jgi:hypothetical protein